MISVKVNISGLQADMDRLTAKLGNLKPAMADIGEYMVVATKERFSEGKGPDGKPWAANRPVTIDRYLKHKGGDSSRRPGEERNNPYFKQDGSLSKRGERQLTAKRPLIGESKRLSTEIASQADLRRLVLSSSLIYSATQQYGAKAGSFGRTKSGRPIPWGDIPARPFLGVSVRDHSAIVDIVDEFLAEGIS